MPSRIIKDSIRTSKTVNAMTDFQFRLWVYLITYVDDYGRGSADPELLKGFVFPRRKGVTESTIEKALADLANSGSVILYEVDGEPYFCFPNWGDHQRIQTKKSKFPGPEFGVSRKSTVSHGESPREDETKPNPNPNPNPEDESNARENALAVILSAYMDKINPLPSEACIAELKGFLESMGKECCLKAIEIAMDEKKTSWSYIRAILKNKQAQGVKCLADWEKAEEARQKQKPGRKPVFFTGNADPEKDAQRAKEDMERTRRIMERMRQEEANGQGQ